LVFAVAISTVFPETVQTKKLHMEEHIQALTLMTVQLKKNNNTKASS
jgi:hypothetical protein